VTISGAPWWTKTTTQSRINKYYTPWQRSLKRHKQCIGEHAWKEQVSKAQITSKIKHAIKLAIKLKIIAATTSSCNKSPARLAQLLQP